MGNNLELTGMVLSAMPVGEYDKRIVLLTKEAGKISAFARGAKRPNSQMLAPSTPMAFGQFEAYRGQNSYTISKAKIHNFFSSVTADYDKVCLASYFLEIADYYAQENADEKERLHLLYQTLRAIESDKFSHRLIRMVYELKTMVIEGEYPEVFSCMSCHATEKLQYFSLPYSGTICTDCHTKAGGVFISQSELYTLQYIIGTPVEQLYKFRLSEELEEKVFALVCKIKKQYMPHTFRSEQFLA